MDTFDFTKKIIRFFEHTSFCTRERSATFRMRRVIFFVQIKYVQIHAKKISKPAVVFRKENSVQKIAAKQTYVSFKSDIEYTWISKITKSLVTCLFASLTISGLFTSFVLSYNFLYVNSAFANHFTSL